ncbi:MAG TPA: maleylpyruvate isomerase family mycothiol-dependent enzyme [Streptosporangiaceae bacterium]
MPPLPVIRHFAELGESTAALAALVDGAEPDLPVPSCPGWTLRQLATHVGRAHRWAAEIVRTRSADFIEFRSVPDGRLPDDPGARGPWLTSGASRLTDAVREADQDRVWAFGELRPASFWARRMAHETLVHGADAALACGRQPVLTAEFASDAIDEWLAMASGRSGGEPDPRSDALPDGRSLHVHVTDRDLDGTGEWLVRRADGGLEVSAGHAKADVALTGPAADVLLVLLRRLPATHHGVTVHGDADLLARWLERTSF